MPQTETHESDAPARGMPYESALMEVIKGLHHDPILLFGMGAGILIVAVLAFTTSIGILIVVAALFVAMLFARAHQRAQRVRKDADVSGTLFGSRARRARIGKAHEGFTGKLRGRAFFSSVEDSDIGTVGSTRRPKPKPPEE